MKTKREPTIRYNTWVGSTKQLYIFCLTCRISYQLIIICHYRLSLRYIHELSLFINERVHITVHQHAFHNQPSRLTEFPIMRDSRDTRCWVLNKDKDRTNSLYYVWLVAELCTDKNKQFLNIKVTNKDEILSCKPTYTLSTNRKTNSFLSYTVKQSIGTNH